MCDPPPPPRAVVGECTNVPGGCRFNECLLENEKYKKESSRRICTFSQRGSLLNFDHFQILRAIRKGSFEKVGILGISSDAHAPASASPFCTPEAQLFSPPASPSRRKRHTRRHKLDIADQPMVVSYNDCFSPASLDIKDKLTSDPFGVSLLDDDIDWDNYFRSAPWEGGLIKDNSHTSNPSKTAKFIIHYSFLIGLFLLTQYILILSLPILRLLVFLLPGQLGPSVPLHPYQFLV
ncbi:M-phase phosphoprotein 8 [Sarotherodon galilaeus]